MTHPWINRELYEAILRFEDSDAAQEYYYRIMDTEVERNGKRDTVRNQILRAYAMLFCDDLGAVAGQPANHSARARANGHIALHLRHVGATRGQHRRGKHRNGHCPDYGSGCSPDTAKAAAPCLQPAGSGAGGAAGSGAGAVFRYDVLRRVRPRHEPEPPAGSVRRALVSVAEGIQAQPLRGLSGVRRAGPGAESDLF